MCVCVCVSEKSMRMVLGLFGVAVASRCSRLGGSFIRTKRQSLMTPKRLHYTINASYWAQRERER